MSFIDSNIFKTLGLYTVYGSKKGILAIGTYNLDVYNVCKRLGNIYNAIYTVNNKGIKLTAFVCYDESFVNNFNNLTEFRKDLFTSDYLDKRIIRNKSKMLQFIKFNFPNSQLNPIRINDFLVYDCPIIHLSSGYSILWKPAFEDTLNKNNYKIIDNYFLYEYKRDILLLVDINKRHEASFIYERLAIDLKTNKASLQYTNIVNNVFTQCSCDYKNSNWVIQKINKVPVYGYKFGKDEVIRA